MPHPVISERAKEVLHTAIVHMLDTIPEDHPWSDEIWDYTYDVWIQADIIPRVNMIVTVARVTHYESAHLLEVCSDMDVQLDSLARKVVDEVQARLP